MESAEKRSVILDLFRDACQTDVARSQDGHRTGNVRCQMEIAEAG
jgi:hypothetical protein